MFVEAADDRHTDRNVRRTTRRTTAAAARQCDALFVRLADPRNLRGEMRVHAGKFFHMSSALPVFTDEQRDLVHRLLALRVAEMMGRKLEEADWTDVYSAALGIRSTGWSNLDIDIVHNHLGVEQKALKYKSTGIEEACGTTLMHPSLTRSIRIDSTESDPEKAKSAVFAQYAKLVADRTAFVQRQNTSGLEVEMRNGWLLWQESLRQFLYFEEQMLVPKPEDYFAEWRVSGKPDGRRKPSKNLWIFERDTGRKRYSVTTEAGAKIQPYFDVPSPNDENLYIFTVIGEQIDFGHVRVWVARRTSDELQRLLGSLEPTTIEAAILKSATQIAAQEPIAVLAQEDSVLPLVLTESTYGSLVKALPGVNDDHRFQLLLEHLRSFA